MVYKYSGQMEEDFIADLLRIDAFVFDSSILGSDNSIRRRFNANRDMCILAYDNSEAVGYIAFFPITENLRERMMNENKAYDDEIVADDILPYTDKHDFDVFLISAAILPDYQGKGIGAELMKRCFDFLSDKVQSGCKIKNAYSYAFTDAGARILGKAGFAEVKKIEDPKSVYTARLMRYSF